MPTLSRTIQKMRWKWGISGLRSLRRSTFVGRWRHCNISAEGTESTGAKRIQPSALRDCPLQMLVEGVGMNFILFWCVVESGRV
jgi:hypothetical protein